MVKIASACIAFFAVNHSSRIYRHKKAHEATKSRIRFSLVAARQFSFTGSRRRIALLLLGAPSPGDARVGTELRSEVEVEAGRRWTAVDAFAGGGLFAVVECRLLLKFLWRLAQCRRCCGGLGSWDWARCPIGHVLSPSPGYNATRGSP